MQRRLSFRCLVRDHNQCYASRYGFECTCPCHTPPAPQAMLDNDLRCHICGRPLEDWEECPNIFSHLFPPEPEKGAQ